MSARQRPGKLLAIDWDARNVRIVSASLSRRSAKVNRILSVTIPPEVDVNVPDQLGALIRRALDQDGINARHAVVDVPRTQATLNTLKLPVTAPEELPNIVEIQIAKELPFPLGEAMVDFTVAPHEPDAVSAEVLVAAVRKEMIARYEQTISAAGLKLDRIGLRPYANKVAVERLLQHTNPERVLFIDIGPTYTEINVIRNGFLAFSRSALVNVPATFAESPILSIVRPDAEAEAIKPLELDNEETPATRPAIVQSLLMEVTRSVEAYRGKDAGAKLDHVVIGGDSGVEEALAEAIQSRMGVTAELYNPASSFGWSADEGAAAAAFASTLGLVLGYADDGVLHFDFLHPKKTVTAGAKRLKMAPMAASIAIMFIGATAMGVSGMTAPQRKIKADLADRISALEKSSEANKNFIKFVDEVRKFEGKQLVWVDVMYDLVQLLPPNEEFVVNNLEGNQKDNQVTLKTRSKKRDTAMELMKKINDFRRDGRDAPRFKVSMGPQKEKKGDKYPFSQDLRVIVLDDDVKSKGSNKKSEPKNSDPKKDKEPAPTPEKSGPSTA